MHPSFADRGRGAVNIAQLVNARIADTILDTIDIGLVAAAFLEGFFLMMRIDEFAHRAVGGMRLEGEIRSLSIPLRYRGEAA